MKNAVSYMWDATVLEYSKTKRPHSFSVSVEMKETLPNDSEHHLQAHF